MSFSLDDAWRALEDVKDPEIPVVSVVEMGIVRSVELEGERVQVKMTPTFAGCPALHAIREDIATRLLEAGAAEVEVVLSLSPPWTSDWITPEARRKLKEFGLAPPPHLGGAMLPILSLEVAACPYCGSEDTTLKNSFGPTLCRAIFTCNGCHQPFEQFKPL